MNSPPTGAVTRLAPISSLLAAAVLALLLGLQPVMTDVYLPALPALGPALDASMAQTQLTMSVLILVFGVAQLAWGPVADRCGRRPVLLASLTLFVVASVGAALASHIGLLIFWRGAQGAFLAAAVVCARAIVRDLYEPSQGAHVMAKAMSGLGLIAISSPIIGGAAAVWFGWRGAMAAMAGFVVVALLVVWRALPETIPARNPRALHLRPLVETATTVLRNPTFIAYTALVSCTYGAMFSILAGAPFAYIRTIGISPTQAGMAIAIGSIAYFSGTLWCRRLLLRHGIAGAVKRGAVFTLLGGVGMAACASAELRSPLAVLLPHCLFGFGHGVHQPCGQAGAVGPFPHAAGVASALAGFFLALTSFAVGLWLGEVLDERSLKPMAYTMLGLCIATCIVAWTLVQRHGHATH